MVIEGDTIVAVGPSTGAMDGLAGDAVVVDCAGRAILPTVVDLGAPVDVREVRYLGETGVLRAGGPADLVVLDGGPAFAPERVDVVVLGGEVRTFGGELIDPGELGDVAGVWRDETGFLEQELRMDGRYDETRARRRHAYQGRYWLTGNRIDYLDDTGFWAYGEVRDGVLHHATFTLRPEAR